MVINHSSSEGQEGAAKKTYERPSFRYEEVFVTSALTCAKQPLTQTCFNLLPASSS